MTDWTVSYPSVHRSLAPAYQGMSQEQIEEVVEGIFGAGTTLDMAEGFFDGIGNALSGVGRAVSGVAQQAAPYLARALPGVASGAATGAALGPWGALAGGLIGGLTSALSTPPRPGSGATPRQPAVVGGPSAQLGGLTAGFMPPQLAGGGARAADGAARSTGAIFQLVNALGSPTVQHGVTSMLMGSAGSPTVPAANGNPIPLAAIANLLSMLASRASAEWEELSPYAGEDYLEAYVDEGFDTSSEDDRAEWLYGQLAPPPPPTAVVPAPDATYDEAWLDDMYDEMEAAYYRHDG